MMRRLGWFITGAAAGAGAMRVAKRRVRTVARRLSPRRVQDQVLSGVRSRVDAVGDAVREGRAAKSNRERALRARLDGRVERIDERLAPEDTVLLDGEPVDRDRLIVVRSDADQRVR
ncbi:MAG: hypothetical protein O2925_06945 [Actinomycetota bacterium]|jgi:hypothetical protein|nr:hypothetical protein [Actinomycetota bacterium]MDA3014170.1 hypothetical protein [Actinomycetota bacterium]MDA3028521.1 hypothetical protein [Actinomycetota bacterium]